MKIQGTGVSFTRSALTVLLALAALAVLCGPAAGQLYGPYGAPVTISSPFGAIASANGITTCSGPGGSIASAGGLVVGGSALFPLSFAGLV